MLKAVLALSCLLYVFCPDGASAWGYQGHEVVGSIADKLLNQNARQQVAQILGAGLDLRISGPWADRVKSVVLLRAGRIKPVDPDATHRIDPATAPVPAPPGSPCSMTPEATSPSCSDNAARARRGLIWTALADVHNRAMVMA